MAKKTPGFDAGEKVTIQYISDLFEEAKFSIQDQLDLGPRGIPDLVVSRVELGATRHYAIEVVLVKEASRLPAKMEQLHDFAASIKRPDQYDEFWLVSNLSLPAKPGRLRRYTNRRVRHFTIKELELLLAQQRPKTSKPKGNGNAKTRIGKAIEANEKQIVLAIVALKLQIEDKLSALKEERPNSSDAIAKVNTSISEFEEMRAELERIRIAVLQFKKKEVKEKEVVKSVNTFKDTVGKWWNKSHERIYDSTSSSALFIGAAGLLHAMNADSGAALAVVGSLIGGETVVKALKSLPRGLFKNRDS